MPRKRTQISITLSKEILDWIDKKVDDLTFGNRSHAIEKALTKLKNEMEKKKG